MTARRVQQVTRVLLKNPVGPSSDEERTKLRERYRWEVVGPNPL